MAKHDELSGIPGARRLASCCTRPLETLIERTTFEAVEGMQSSRAFREARRAYRPSSSGGVFDQAG
ncbi:MAG: hypothetical protein AB1725_09090 [Armatimonadota bacterium]